MAIRRGSADAGKRGNTIPLRVLEPATPIVQFFSRYRRVGLDTICFIYHMSKHPLYSSITTELFALIEAGRLAAVTSSIALIEILARPKELGHHVAAENYKVVLATFPNLELRRSDVAIAEQAADLRFRYRLATPEAIQLATALVDGADAFVGNTEAVRRVKEIEVVLLEDLRASITPEGRA